MEINLRTKKNFLLITTCLFFSFMTGCAMHTANYSKIPPYDNAYIPAYPAAPGPKEQTIDNILIKGKKYLHSGEIEKALDLFEDAYFMEPSNPWAAYYLSKSWAENGDFETAREFAAKAKWLFSTDVEMRRMAIRQEALCLKALGHISAANNLLMEEKKLKAEKYD